YKILRRELTLESKQFQVWFQPIYSIENKRFEYMEALSRLRDTELGTIPPQEFVQVAENRGLIELLGFVAFEKVCKFLSENRDSVNAVSINFSAYQMMNPKIVENVLNTISRFSLSPSNIIMEITESIFIDNYDLVMKNMLALTQAGVKFYLDDFGTGYSNLTNVISLPFSTIKMDRSLVLAMEEGNKGVSLFFDLVSTFKGVGFNILVEGVETNLQNKLVERAGVDYIQGFLYSRPLPPDECVELLKRKH
ncbi:MAG: EAL domain-containing protein, partial [Treponema sp.]|nr:EAL domain-containing protein [Treponema sp.]